MNKFLGWLPTSFPDFIAGVLVVTGIIILAMGIDGEVKTLTGMGAVWLFRSAISNSKGQGGK